MLNLKELLTHNNAQKSSDLHLATGLPPFLRINGDMSRAPMYPVVTNDALEQIFKEIFSPKQLEELANSLELDASFTMPGVGRFRANAFFQTNGPAIVLRAIPDAIPSFADINAPEALKILAQKKNGLILVTGATGMGKSTTLAAMINYINQTRPYHIITIEDPIEFIYKSEQSLITQRELHRSTRSFQSALRSALREDPDAILVGELRDIETIRMALTAAETGHLVLATLHTMSAPKTVDRIIDVFEGSEKAMIRTLLAESLQGIVSQILLKNTQGDRVAAFEILVCNTAIRNLIRDDKVGQMYSVMQFGKEHGMQTLDQSLKDLVKAGLISKQEALPHAIYKPTFT
jgi:twitching motility protein PilT